jgi:DNA-binding transcriptional regulator YiaG
VTAFTQRDSKREPLKKTELAQRMGVTVSMIRLWENNGSRPDARQYNMLNSLLTIEPVLEMAKSNS